MSGEIYPRKLGLLSPDWSR